VQLGQPA
jgi:hypothetical protein